MLHLLTLAILALRFVSPSFPSPDGTPLSDNQKKKRAKQAEKEKQKAEKAAKQQQDQQEKQASEVDFAAQNYGELPLNQSQERYGRHFTPLEEISPEHDGKAVFFSARIQTSRTPSSESDILRLHTLPLRPCL